MGFYSTTLEQEKPHQKTSDCAQKTASGKFFASNRNRTYQIERNPLENQQEKLTATRETASGVFFYKYRHYSAELGRWLGRDPIEDIYGIKSIKIIGYNLYQFVQNQPLHMWDYNGLACRVYFTCKLKPSSPTRGLGFINCTYNCVEKRREFVRGFIDSGLTKCTDIPEVMSLPDIGSTQFCSCSKEIKQMREYSHSDFKSNCSRKNCSAGCGLFYLPLLKAAKGAAKAALELAKATCMDTCNVICKKP